MMNINIFYQKIKENNVLKNVYNQNNISKIKFVKKFVIKNMQYNKILIYAIINVNIIFKIL